MSYKSHNIKVQFALDNGTFDGSSNNVLSIENVRCNLVLHYAGGLTGLKIEMQLYGLKQDEMAKLGRYGRMVLQPAKNQVKVWADEQLIFLGTISFAYGDYNSQPDVPLFLEAYTDYFQRTTKDKSNSYSGSTDVASIIESMAKTAGFGFVNNGVTTKLNDPHFDGSIMQQISKCVEDAGICMLIRLGTIYIWSAGKFIDNTIIETSPQNGLIGYPVFTGVGMDIRTMFSNEIFTGRRMKITTSMPSASGTYYIRSAEHYLSTWQDGGQWFTLAKLSVESIQ